MGERRFRQNYDGRPEDALAGLGETPDGEIRGDGAREMVECRAAHVQNRRVDLLAETAAQASFTWSCLFFETIPP
jgi:hypothetical protein